MSASHAQHHRAIRYGLVLTGGGARSAYQVGVLKALASLLPPKARCPFPIVTGTSAGAVSAAVLAADPLRFRAAVHNLERVWRGFHVNQVFRSDARTVLRSGLHWLLALISGGYLARPPRSLLDNEPLAELLKRMVPLARLRLMLRARHVHGLAVSADNKRLIVNSRLNSAVYVYSLPDLKLLGAVDVGIAPDWVTLTPDGKAAYVANAGSNDVSVVDMSALREVTRIPVGQVPKRNITAMLP